LPSGPITTSVGISRTSKYLASAPALRSDCQLLARLSGDSCRQRRIGGAGRLENDLQVLDLTAICKAAARCIAGGG
jgi:hypothetical protein